VGRAIQVNTHGKPIELITPNFLYQELAKTDETGQKRYTGLFEHLIADYTLDRDT